MIYKYIKNYNDTEKFRMKIIETEKDSNLKLEKYAYSHRNDMEEIALMSGIRRVGERCFEACLNLKNVHIPDTIVSVKNGAFADCCSLENVVLSERLSRIEASTFENCVKLQEVTIPKSVKYIGKHAFLNCSSLKQVILEGEEIRINPSAFEGCLNLEFETAVKIAGCFDEPMNLIIRKGTTGIAGRLRTFEKRYFVFDGIPCSSIESVLESFKFREREMQEYICSLCAVDAYSEGQSKEALEWETTQKLYWNDVEYERSGVGYQKLLDRLFQAVFEQDAQFRLDVAFLKNAEVQSKLGGYFPEKNVITRNEFIERILRFANDRINVSMNDQEMRSVKEQKKISHENTKQNIRKLENEDLQYSNDRDVRNTVEVLPERQDNTRKIIVMGGSFNPPTIAHEKILLSAVNALQADAGIFVPSSHAYVERKMKKQRLAKWVLSEEVRYKMLQAMCEDDKRLFVDDCEFQDDGRGHTYETMQKIQEKYPDATLYFLVGGDKLNILTRWRSSEAFFEQFKFAVMKRDGMNPEEQIHANPRLLRYKNIFYMVPEPDGIEGISSTLLRDKLSAGDESAAELVHPKVWELLLNAGWIHTEIRSFRGEYHFLSNFYEVPIEYKGLVFSNAEAAFQAQKCLTEEEKVLFTEYPASKAKRFGRQVQLRHDWEEVKLGLMEEIVRAKFRQNPEVARLLLSTGDRELIEGNTWHDVYWGVDIRTEEGENHLGKILMKIREELKEI